jgi:hypothetical protein
VGADTSSETRPEAWINLERFIIARTIRHLTIHVTQAHDSPSYKPSVKYDATEGY